jgi:hypothetical protein
VLPGCERQEEIQTYTAPTHESIQTPEYLKLSAARKPQPLRMIAAVVPEGPNLWLFRIQGAPDAVVAKIPDFRKLMKSVRFPAAGNLEWDVPADWKERKGDGALWYTTLVVPGTPSLDLAVIKAPASRQLTVTSIVNYCRGELQLKSIEPEDLPSRTETMTVGDLSMIMVDITGTKKPAPPAGDGEAEEPETVIPFKMPEGWTQVRPKNALTMAAFVVKAGSQEANITLSRAGGSKTANVNRWRGQMGLAPQSDAEIVKALEKVKVGSRTGLFVELKNEKQTMLGLMLDAGDQTVFVKLTGDPELAIQEKTRFLEFAESLRF